MSVIADFLRRNESQSLESKQDLSSPERLLPHPELRIPAGEEFTVTSDVTANARQQWFMSQLSDGYLVKAEDIARKFEVTNRTARRDISQLQDADLVGFMGSFKTGRYVLLKQTPEAPN